MRKIVFYPNEILRVETKDINSVDEKLQVDVDELMWALQKEKDHAAGLAAVQVGLDRRFFGLVTGQKRNLQIFINPRVVKTFGQKLRPIMTFDDGAQEDFLEGCLSFPGLFGTVKRYLRIEAEWEELKNKKLERKSKVLEGIEAIAYQHELDHLNGILFIDHIKEEGGELYMWEGDRKKRVDINQVVEEEIKYGKK